MCLDQLITVLRQKLEFMQSFSSSNPSLEPFNSRMLSGDNGSGVLVLEDEVRSPTFRSFGVTSRKTSQDVKEKKLRFRRHTADISSYMLSEMIEVEEDLAFESSRPVKRHSRPQSTSFGILPAIRQCTRSDQAINSNAYACSDA